MRAKHKQTPLISIVVCAQQDSPSFRESLRSAEESVGNFETEIVVVTPLPELLGRNYKLESRAKVLFVRDSGIGVYSALNDGLNAISGDFVVILHAGDKMSSGYIQKLLSAWEPGTVCFANRIFGESLQESSSEVSGYSFFHKHIIHNTFLVARSDFTQVGDFNTDFQILADHDWTQRAIEHGLRFRKVDTGMDWYQMEAGGISTAKTAEDRELFKKEWIKLQKLRYPRLPESIAWSIYEYRFNENHLKPILSFCRAARSELDDNSTFFPELKAALVTIWEQRTVGFDSPDAHRRLAVCEELNINRQKSNIAMPKALEDPLAVSQILGSEAEEFEFHLVPVYNSPTETFVSDTIQALHRDGKVQVVICEKKFPADLTLGREVSPVLVLEVGKFAEQMTTSLLKYLVQTLGPATIYAHWLVSAKALDAAIGVLPRKTSVLLMAYGIDVTNIENQAEEASGIQDRFLSRAGVALVASSEHLRSRLLSAGFSEKKTFVVRPSVSLQVNLSTRRGPGSRNDTSSLRLLNTGRLVRFKRQEDILEAMAILKMRGIVCELTILAGSRLDRKEFLLSRVDALELDGKVRILDHASRAEVARHLERADVYVSSAMAAKVDASIHTETFGVALAEARVAGLPVVTSLEGGQPEVIDGGGQLAKGYRPGNVEELADCIQDFYENYPSLEERKASALRASSKFSIERRLAELEEIGRELAEGSVRVLHFSKSAYPGAGSGAFRLHRAMLAYGTHSSFISLNHSDPQTHSQTLSGIEKVRHPRPFRGNTIFSVDSNPVSGMSRFKELVESHDVFIVHLFRDLLSLEDLLFLAGTGKPVFLVIRDYSTISGGCHYARSCEGWKGACLPCPQFNHNDQFNLPLLQQEARKELFSFPNVTGVFLSHSQAKKMAGATALRGSRTTVIPNVAPPDFPSPVEKEESRREHHLPRTSKIVGIFSTYDADVKGKIWLSQHINDITDTSTLVLVGDGFRKLASDNPAVRWFPNLAPDRVASLMKAMDCVLIASEEETFSNVALEAALSGVPVVGGDTGILPTLKEMKLAFCGPNEEWLSLISSAYSSSHPTDFRQRLSARFSGDSVVQNWVTLIDQEMSQLRHKNHRPTGWRFDLNDYRQHWLVPSTPQNRGPKQKARDPLERLRGSEFGKFLRRKVPWRWRRRIGSLLWGLPDFFVDSLARFVDRGHRY